MTQQIDDRLSSVHRRQHRVRLFRYAAVGLLLGSVFGLLLAVARIQGGDVTPLATIVAAVTGVLGGLLLGWFQTPPWKQSAQAVDAHYQLKDRSTTALEFSRTSDANEFHRLQVRDAVRHLDTINAKEVVPIPVPPLFPLALVSFVAVVALAAMPIVDHRAEVKSVEPLETVLDEAGFLEETTIKELKQIANEYDEKTGEEANEGKLQELTEQLDGLLQEMKAQGVDRREALAKLSEMQAAIAAAQVEFNMDVVDTQMKTIGDAMSSSSSMRSAARAFREGDYEKAAEKLESLDVGSISEKEAKSVANDLQKLTKPMAEVGLKQLSKATSEFREGLTRDEDDNDEGNDGREGESGAAKLVEQSRKYSLRKKVDERLRRQMSRLSESKGNLTQSGGSSRKRRSEPSSSWGRGSGGDPLGSEATPLVGSHHKERITGIAGDGPSERGVTHSPEGREAATRQQRLIYREYRKQAEEVLQNEALPLGHRQTIRQYFESIRPSNAADLDGAGSIGAGD